MNRHLSISLILLFLLSSCSFKSITIKYLDYFALKKVSERLHLESEQKEELEPQIELLLKQVVPEVKQIKVFVQNIDLNNPQFAKIFQEIQPIYLSVAKKFVAIFHNQLAGLSKKQLKRVIEDYNKENEKNAKRYKKKKFPAKDKYEDLLGELTPEQEELIDLNRDFYKNLNTTWVKRREASLKITEEIILSDTPKSEKIKALDKLFFDNTKMFFTNTEINKNISLVQKIVQMSSEKQKERIKEKQEDILEWIDAYLHQFQGAVLSHGKKQVN